MLHSRQRDNSGWRHAVCRGAINTFLLLALAACAAGSTVAVQSSLQTPTLGSPVQFTATVSPSTATGTVTFLDGVNVLGIGPLSNGQARLTTSLLTAGAHSIAAFYDGGVSAPLSLTVRSLPDFGFQAVPSVSVSQNLNRIVVADFNDDGIPDLAITDTTIYGFISVTTSNLTVLLGNGDGSFRITTHLTNTDSEAVATGDFNGDGITDIATLGGVYLGNGDGTFGGLIPFTFTLCCADSAQFLVAGDFNGDGRVDLAWSGPVNGQSSAGAGVVGVLAGNGDGTFQASVITGMAGAGAIALGDFNRDGRADLAIANGTTGMNSVTILLGNGDCSFQTPAYYDVGSIPTSIAVADFNGDGRDDIAVAGYLTLPATTGGVSVLLGNSDGTLEPAVNYMTPTGTGGLVTGDFNGDGRIDVIVAYGTAAAQNLYLMPGNGDGTLQSPNLVAPYLGTFVSGDFNNDGRTDLAENGNSVEVLLGQPAPPGSAAISKVVSAASFQAPIEAGSWVTIQGANLANDTRVWQASDFIGNDLPTVIDGVSVTIDGTPAFVEYISPTQINVQAPSNNATGMVNVIVTNNGAASPPAAAQLQAVAPAFFMTPSYNAVASVFPSYTPVASTAPAMPGDIVVLWGTGFGPTNPPTTAGTIVSGAPATATLPVVTVGGIGVPVVSSVLTTGTAGLYQIAIQLPANVPTGTPAVQASIGGVSTQPAVALFVGAQ